MNMGEQESRRAAERLVNSQGMAAMESAAQKIKVAGERGDEETKIYWEKILKEVEHQLYES